MKAKAFIFDIDGTVADLTHRLHFIKGVHCTADCTHGVPDYELFHDALVRDEPIQPIIDIARMLHDPRPVPMSQRILLVTGRDEKWRHETIGWLNKHDMPFDALFMRQHGDHRPDYVLKAEIYDNEIAPYYDVRGVYDDRPPVVAMYWNKGLTVHQVFNGRVITGWTQEAA